MTRNDRTNRMIMWVAARDDAFGSSGTWLMEEGRGKMEEVRWKKAEG
jgi:hypothetical protein